MYEIKYCLYIKGPIPLFYLLRLYRHFDSLCKYLKQTETFLLNKLVKNLLEEEDGDCSEGPRASSQTLEGGNKKIISARMVPEANFSFQQSDL